MTLSATALTLSAGNNLVITASGATGFIQLGEITAPAQPAANLGVIYAKDVSAVSHVFWKADDNTEFDLTLGAGSEVTTWTQDHSAGGFDLNSLSNLVFQNSASVPLSTERSIHYNDAEGMVFNSITGDIFRFEINNALQVEISLDRISLFNGTLDMGAGTIEWNSADQTIFVSGLDIVHDVAATGEFFFRVGDVNQLIITDTILNLAGNLLQFNDANTTLQQSGGILQYDVASTFSHQFRVNNAIEWTLNATEILGASNNNVILTGTGFAQMDEQAGDPAAGTTSGKYYVKVVGGLAKPFFIGDGTAAVDLSSGGSQTPWASTIDAADFSLENLDILDFNTVTDTPVVGAAQIWWNSASSMFFNIPTGDTFAWTIQGAAATMSLSATVLDIGNVILQFEDTDMTIQNASTNFQFDVGSGGSHIFRVDNLTQLTVTEVAVDFNNNILLIGTGLMQFTNANTTIIDVAGVMTYDVASTFTHNWRVNNTIEMQLSATILNLPNAAFQENAIPISPIGTHDDYYDAGNLIEVTSATPDTAIIGTTTNRKGVLKMDYLNGATEFATIKLTPPRNWDASTITVVFKWVSLVEGSGVVRWGVAGVAVADLDDLSASATDYGSEITVDDTQTNADEEQFSPRTAAVTLANTPAAGDSVYLRIQRLGAVAGDTFDQIASLLGIFVEWGIDAATAT